MRNDKSAPQTVDDYIGTFPAAVRQLLEELRRTIREAAPGAEEAIVYQIPTFRLNGNLIHFGAYKSHIGFYPAPSAMKAFACELAEYECAKGSVRFPIDRPLPLVLISEIVRFRVRENLAKRKK